MKHRTVGASDENIQFARELRRKLSLPEVLLWRVLRAKPEGLKFRKQFPIGGYVADFACLSRRLLIEIDGDNHSYGNRPERDAIRDQRLRELGYDTLRISAVEVLESIDGVIAQILHSCASRPLHRPPSPSATADGPPPRSGEDLA